MSFLESIRRRGVVEAGRRVYENAVWDIADGLATSQPPLTIRVPLFSKESSKLLIDNIFNPLGKNKTDLQERLRRQVNNLPRGTYVMRQYVGDTKEGTAHPHYFVVDRDENDATLLFVDPEHYLNKSGRHGRIIREGDIRPQVCNLMAIRFHKNEALPDVAITRFRTVALNDPAQVTFETQLEAARNLFENEGIPAEIRDREEELIMRLIVEPSSQKPMLLQSRYTKNPDDLFDFLAGEPGFSFLRGKARSFWGLMCEFAVNLERGAGAFKPQPRLRRAEHLTDVL